MGAWIIAASIGAVFWGLNYTLSGKLVRVISIPTLLALYTAGECVVAVTFSWKRGTLSSDIRALDAQDWLLLTAFIGSGLVAHSCSYFATQQKNATLAGLLEISYPLFAAVTAYLLFGEKHFSKASLVGAGFILVGVYIVASDK